MGTHFTVIWGVIFDVSLYFLLTGVHMAGPLHFRDVTVKEEFFTLQ